MSRDLGSTLPSDLIRELRNEVPRLNAVPLISVDQKGFPHVALLSYFELLYPKDDLYFFISSFSRSFRFLRDRGVCTLIFVHSAFVYYVKGRVRWLGNSGAFSVFLLKVESVIEDFPSREEGDVLLKTGIRFDADEKNVQEKLDLRERIRKVIVGSSEDS